MNNNYCPMHEGKIVLLKLMPEYSSSGIWCECGLSFGNPEILDLSKGLIDLVEGWNLMWEMAQDDKNLNKEYFERIFVDMGNELCSQVSKIIPCYFDSNIINEKWFWDEKNEY